MSVSPNPDEVQAFAARLKSNHMVGLALGMLMHRGHVRQDEALRMLTAVSERTGHSIAAISFHYVQTGEA